MNNRSQWLLLTTRNPSARNVTLGSCGFVGKGVRYTVFLTLASQYFLGGGLPKLDDTGMLPSIHPVSMVCGRPKNTMMV